MLNREDFPDLEDYQFESILDEDKECLKTLVDLGFDVWSAYKTVWSATIDFCDEDLSVVRMNWWDAENICHANDIWITWDVNMVCGGKIELQHWYTKKFDAWQEAIEHVKEIIAQGEDWEELKEFKADPRSDLTTAKY